MLVADLPSRWRLLGNETLRRRNRANAKIVVPGTGDRQEAGSGESSGQVAAHRKGDDRVLVAVDDQHGDADPRGLGEGVEAVLDDSLHRQERHESAGNRRWHRRGRRTRS